MEKVLVGKFEAENKLEEKMLLERRILLEALQENGIDCININCKWPRDYFVNHNGNVCARNINDFYADGGYILNNSEFTLVCADVSKIDGKIVDDTDKRSKKLKELYGENIFILPAPNLKPSLDSELNKNLSPHIDLVVLPIPEKKLLFVDLAYYRENFKNVGLLCETYNLGLKTVSNDYSKPSYPCNSLVLKKDNRIIVVTNETDNKDFISRLKDYDLDVIAVPFSVNCLDGGSVRCATNTIPEKYTGNIKDLLKLSRNI